MKDNHTLRSLLLWALAIVITMGSAVYQRTTGPTYPVTGELSVNSVNVEYDLPTSHETGKDARISLALPNEFRAILKWRRLNSSDPWQRLLFVRQGDSVVTSIPQQPPAGKVSYEILVETAQGARINVTEEPVIIRFKGGVPLYVLIPHVIFMFFSLLFAARTGLQAAIAKDGYFRMGVITMLLLLVGGLVLGPIVQKYAFDAFWTGWPFGNDLTDNKTAVAFIFWIIALWREKKHRRGRIWFIIAAVVHFGVYLIPHSVLGSELTYPEGVEGR